MRVFPVLIFLAFSLCSCTRDRPGRVLVLPTIHGAHEMNENYTYQDLLQVVKAFDPSMIGVEIRPEDLEIGSDSLDVFYPYEMIMVRDSFPGKIRGIDFYSEDSRNKQVSRKMFSDTTSETYRFKHLAQDMQLDSAFVAEYQNTALPGILEEQRRMVMNFSAEEFLKGRYDSITDRQYQIEDSLFQNSRYAAYPVFNNNRDLQITLNALELVEAHPGEDILILVGANHRSRLVDSLEKRNLEIVRDLSFMKLKN